MSVSKTESSSQDGTDIKTAYDINGPVEPLSETATNTHVAAVVDHHAERALCRKFDYRLLPVLAVMYLFNSLDKGNLGNAKTDGLEKDLHFKNNQYNIILSVFYVPYVIFALPIAMLGKKFSPSVVLPILMACFGSLTILGVAVKNFAGMMTLRWFLGNIANAFSGLLAFGVFQIKNTALSGWRYLFLIEGCLTTLFAAFAYWYLPPNAAGAKFLNEEERKLAYHRIQVDSSSIVNEVFNIKDSMKIFRQPTTYAFLAIEVCLGVPLQSVNLFLPQIVSRLGYSKVKTNLYTVAPNVSGAVVLLILAFTSDLTRRRGPFITLGFIFTFCGMLIYATIDVLNHTNIAYFATFMMCWGTSAPSVLLSTWYNNNTPHEGRRVVLTSVGVPMANVMGLVSSNIFTPESAPKYIPALATTAAFGATGALLAGLLSVYMVWDNNRRDRKLGRKLDIKDVPTELLRDGPSVPEFRWFL
ncbi:hypothetical protein VTL71DRAFT_2259 [Oculimacula yallundae]|uniref:MFS transporter n=1 Tax=Oculimacula yallundae TaxID=86028 RepID=A0ABR4CAM7_9HELO